MFNLHLLLFIPPCLNWSEMLLGSKFTKIKKISETVMVVTLEVVSGTLLDDNCMGGRLSVMQLVEPIGFENLVNNV